MITINCEGWVRSETALHKVYFKARGTTKEEVLADMEKQSEGLEQVTSVAINNNVADWIRVFGKPEGECAFADFVQKES